MGKDHPKTRSLLKSDQPQAVNSVPVQAQAITGMVEADCLTGVSEKSIKICDQPLPTLMEGVEEAAALAKLQQEDDSLVELRRKGSEQEDGYMLEY